MIWAEQAVYTSLQRKGQAGYHLVSRSPGISDREAQALSRWSPSQGALARDDLNPVSVNFHELPSRRFALSRTCEGPPEYSGRGGHELYTHILVFDDDALKNAGDQPFLLYRDALSLGYPYYRPAPAEHLDRVRLSRTHHVREASDWFSRALELGLPAISSMREALIMGRPIRFLHDGDRIRLAEFVISSLPREVVRRTSFTTGLVPSIQRPFTLTLTGSDVKKLHGSAPQHPAGVNTGPLAEVYREIPSLSGSKTFDDGDPVPRTPVGPDDSKAIRAMNREATAQWLHHLTLIPE